MTLPRILATLRSLRRRRATRRLVTRFALRDPFRVWQALNALDTCISQHRKQGATHVVIRLEFEERGDE